MPKISVIVPIYRVETYIERCARSLFEQTLDDIEFIFIDDCSPDRSVEILISILNEYPNRQNDVIIHHMENNSGQAAVREWGIRHATGEYLIHCDSDDWTDKRMYEIMYQTAKKTNADIVFCDYNIVSDKYSRIVSKAIDSNDTNISLIKKILLDNISLNYLWSALIKRELNRDIIYPRNNLGEDFALMVQYLFYSHKFVHLKEPLYYYWENPGSICKIQDRDSSIRKLNDRASNLDLVFGFLHNKGLADQFEDEIVFAKMYCRYFTRFLRNDKNFKKSWNKLYPEINNKVAFNKYIPLKLKLYHLLVNFNLGNLV